jgi:hypothetical protein
LKFMQGSAYGIAKIFRKPPSIGENESQTLNFLVLEVFENFAQLL